MNQNAEYSAVNDAVRGQFLRKVWRLITPDWRSEEKGQAWLLLLVVLGLSLFSVAVSVWFNSWNRDFYNALENKDYDAVTHLLMYFSVIAVVAIVTGVFTSYLQQMLTIRWRRWLTETYFAQWLGHKNYYHLEYGRYTDNPDQRISEDLNAFTSSTLTLGLGFIANLVSLVSFSVILWGVSGSIEIWGITIPGYMFWAALIYAVIGSWLTHLIGRKLIGLSNRQQRFEADLRFSLVRVRENAESIALFNGEPNEHQQLSARFGRVWSNFWNIMQLKKRLNFFTSGYSQIAIIFPFVVAAPRYFSGKMLELGVLMQVAQAFGSVQGSLSWFVDAYTLLPSCRATSDRLLSLGQAMQENESRTMGIGSQHQGGDLQVKDLSLDLADGRHLPQGADLTVAEGDRPMHQWSFRQRQVDLATRHGQPVAQRPRHYSPAGRTLFVPAAKTLPADWHAEGGVELSTGRQRLPGRTLCTGPGNLPPAASDWPAGGGQSLATHALAGRAAAPGFCPCLVVRAAMAVHGRSHVGDG